jgi:hypothetical protein
LGRGFEPHPPYVRVALICASSSGPLGPHGPVPYLLTTVCHLNRGFGRYRSERGRGEAQRECESSRVWGSGARRSVHGAVCPLDARHRCLREWRDCVDALPRWSSFPPEEADSDPGRAPGTFRSGHRGLQGDLVGYPWPDDPPVRFSRRLDAGVSSPRPCARGGSASSGIARLGCQTVRSRGDDNRGRRHDRDRSGCRSLGRGFEPHPPYVRLIACRVSAGSAVSSLPARLDRGGRSASPEWRRGASTP